MGGLLCFLSTGRPFSGTPTEHNHLVHEANPRGLGEGGEEGGVEVTSYRKPSLIALRVFFLRHRSQNSKANVYGAESRSEGDYANKQP